MKREVKDALKAGYFQVYKACQRAGITVMPAHYYSAEPNILELERSKQTWSQPLSLRGIHIDLDEQVANLEDICLPFQREYLGNVRYLEATRSSYGPGYGYVEAQALHAVVRHYKPACLIEIGSGVSTWCSLYATKLNADEDNRPCRITCIEPYPSAALTTLAAREPAVEIRRQPVQETPLSIFSQLGPNDILFVDSSHVVKAGSDVVRIMLDILPVLQPGVIIHFHDIYLPYAYQRDVLETFLHNNETPFLAAFLTFNDRFRILFSLSLLHYERTDALKAVFTDYLPQPGWRGLRLSGSSEDRHFPSATWLRVTE